MQKVHFSAPFFAVECKRNDMLDYLMRNDKLDLNVRDLVSACNVVLLHAYMW